MSPLRYFILFGSGFIVTFIIGQQKVKKSISNPLSNVSQNKPIIKKRETIAENQVKQKPSFNIKRDYQRETALTKTRNQKKYNQIKTAMGNSYNDYIYDYLNNSNYSPDKNVNSSVDEFDEELFNELEANFQSQLQRQPSLMYDSLKAALPLLEDYPIEQSNLLAKMALVPGKQDEVREILESKLENTFIKESNEDADFKTKEEEIKSYSGTDKQLAFEKNFETLQKVTTDPEDRYQNTIRILNDQKNENVQRNIASDLLEKDKSYAPNLIYEIGLKKTNKLVPAHIEVKENEYGEIEVWDHIEAKDKN